jgi:hypothetical protein
MNLPIQLVRPDTWNALLAHCRTRDVEEGDSPEYMYSVRTSSSALVVWTQPGWKAQWHVGILTPTKRGKKYQLAWTAGDAPTRYQWTEDAIVEHVLMLFHKLAPGEMVSRVKT